MRLSARRSGPLAATSAAMLVCVAFSAHAADSVVCGSANAGWNAPNGAAVTTSSNSGVVTAILGQLGETYSHVMLSHGVVGSGVKMSHAAMVTPRAMAFNTPDDDWYLPDITMADPGAETVGMAAAYSYMYQQPEGPIATAVWVDGGAQGQAAANAVLNLPLCSQVSSGKCRFAISDPTCTTQCSGGALKYGNGTTSVPYGTQAQERYIIGFKDASTGTVYRMSYGVYTFTNGYEISAGFQQSAPYAGLNCSLFMAMANAWGGNGTMTQYTYGPGGSLANATQKLYDTITMMVGAGGGSSTTKTRLGNQLVNCFTSAAKCSDMTNSWTTFKTSGIARTISPDRVRGLGVHSSVNSPWKGAAQTLQWNAPGGNVYGCWGAAHRSSQEYATTAWNSVTPISTTCNPACPSGYTCEAGTCVPVSTCTPSCTSKCGQADGCGGICPSDDAQSCGKCGNPACGGGGCPAISEQNIGLAKGTWKHYTITGTNVTASTVGGTGDVDLYVKLGSQPTTSSYGCRSNKYSNSESCTLNGTGTFYVSLYAYNTVGGTNVSANVSSCSSCTPSCTGDQCGQSDGCGGVCPSTDASSCGKCGNPACCTPSCTGDQCGQADGCGGTCPSTDAASCGKCGNAACGGGSCGTRAYTCTGSTYSCTYTDSDTKWSKVTLTAGTAYTFSSCAGTADTYLRLFDGTSQKVYNDDGCPSGYGSKMVFTPTTTKQYDLYLGFYGSKTGSATVTITPEPTSCSVQR